MPKGQNAKMSTYLQGLYTSSNPDVSVLINRYLTVTAAATPDITKRMLALLAASAGS